MNLISPIPVWLAAMIAFFLCLYQAIKHRNYLVASYLIPIAYFAHTYGYAIFKGIEVNRADARLSTIFLLFIIVFQRVFEIFVDWKQEHGSKDD